MMSLKQNSFSFDVCRGKKVSLLTTDSAVPSPETQPACGIILSELGPKLGTPFKEGPIMGPFYGGSGATLRLLRDALRVS